MTTMQRFVVVGGGGHGREVIEIFRDIAPNGLTLAGVVADGRWDGAELDALGVKHLGGTGDLAACADAYVIAIGHGAARATIDRAATDAGVVAVALVHPDATIGGSVALGPGFIAFPGARVTTNVSIGRHVHLNLNATVSHDCVLGDYVTLSPGAAIAGNVHLGDRVTLGLNASVLPGVRVGAGATIGAGAVVTGDVEPGATVAGVPARPLKPHEPDPRPGN